MYRPPETDSEDDDYDGFSFGDEVTKKPLSYYVADPDQDMFDAVCSGNLEKLIKEIKSIDFDINEPIKGSLTLLHYACRYGKLHMVKYLLESGASVNRQVDSTTPLMEACCNKDNKSSIEIVKILLDRGAVVNVSDKYGMTPFLFACQNGLTDVVQILIDKASLDACDNQGMTPIFHAIEGNHKDIVQILLDAKINIEIVNRRGYSPRQMAQFHCNNDILAMLPIEKTDYIVPTTFLCFSTLQEQIPRIFPKTDIPEYFPDVYKILEDMEMPRFLEFFAKSRIGLYEFLTITDEGMEEIGIQYPFQRGKIKLGLLQYHLNHWSKKSITTVQRNGSETFHDILLIIANHMKHLVTITATMKYIEQNIKEGNFGPVTLGDINATRKLLKKYKKTIEDSKKTTKYLQSFSPNKPPLLIDYDDFKSRKKKSCTKRFIKYSIVIGLSFVICLEIKKKIF